MKSFDYRQFMYFIGIKKFESRKNGGALSWNKSALVSVWTHVQWFTNARNISATILWQNYSYLLDSRNVMIHVIFFITNIVNLLIYWRAIFSLYGNNRTQDFRKIPNGFHWWSETPEYCRCTRASRLSDSGTKFLSP